MKRKCVLIYDDDQEILNICRVILSSENYHVETLIQCENIINDLENIKPDIILMDLWIPQIGGENAIRLMRENNSTRHIPVVLFSANDEIEKISEKIKASAYLKKPFDIHSFRETIETYVS